MLLASQIAGFCVLLLVIVQTASRISHDLGELSSTVMSFQRSQDDLQRRIAAVEARLARTA